MAALVGFSSCRKSDISPANQSTAFVKYYGHVASQAAADLLRTDDGGYILLGSTNSYNTGEEHDVFVVRTDSLGNELWSSSFGRQDGPAAVGSLFEGDYLRFDEAGVRLAKLPDGSAYAIACNRTYVTYSDAATTVGRRGETKIVLYEIDATTGAPTTQEGVELLSNTADTLTEMVADMKIDSSSGIIKYVLTGMTTDVKIKAVIGTNDNKISDRSDVFTLLLDEDYRILWRRGNWTYGFVGRDYGTSIQILPQGYMVCGTVENNYGDQSNFIPHADLLSVILSKDEGVPITPTYYGDGYDFRGGQSVYDKVNGRITILGYVEKVDGGSIDEGSLALVQIDEGGIAQTINGIIGVTYLNVNGTASASSPYISASIDQLPNDEGFILAATYRETNVEYDICLIRVNEEFEVAEGWPYFFGYNEAGGSGVFATREKAGTVVPVVETVSGTSKQELKGYAFTGTFGLGTNDMLGLVKLNEKGTFTP